MSRRTFCATAGSAALLGVAGCATVAEEHSRTRRYDEKVQALLISANGKDLVVLGQQYHYVFTDVPMIAKLIGSSFHDRVDVKFSMFEVSPRNNVFGSYTLIAPALLSAEQIEEAGRLGYARRWDGVLILERNLRGRRYAGTKIDVDSQGTIKRSYSIQVKEDVQAGAPEVTPLTQSGDGKLHLFQFLLVFLFFWAS